MQAKYPERIVCLTEETTETLYLLGEEARIVGISGFTTRPARARKEKPIVSAFTKARIHEIVDLRPDLVLGFSDIQAEIARQLVSAGLEVHVFNHRTVSGILGMIQVLGGMIGCADKAAELAAQFARDLQSVATRARRHDRRPLVYFEEWDSPMITGIGWVSELIELAGGRDVFAELASCSLAKDRVVADASEVVRRDPDMIIASWCGKPFKRDEVLSRPGWSAIRAIRDGEIHAIDSSLILQPGPAALTDGLAALERLISQWRRTQSAATG